MGTSADRSAGSGGAWTPLKTATNSYIRGIGGAHSADLAGRVISRHIPLLGGQAGAASSARAGSSGLQRLGALLSQIGTDGLGHALETLGLTQLVGGDRFTVLDELMTYIAGDGDDLDAQAARDAACDVLDEFFGEANEWNELESTTITREELLAILERFLALYVYNRIPVVAERLSRLSNPASMRQADQEMRQIIGDLVAINLPEDPFIIDWAHGGGKALADNAIETTYAALVALEDGDRA